MAKTQKTELRGKFSQNLHRKTSKSRVIAAILAIIFGGLGIHKFYLGQVGWGILYLVFAWTGISWIIGIIEGIMYLTMSDQTFEAKYS